MSFGCFGGMENDGFVMSVVPYGCDGILVRVEADIRRGIPGIDVSGLAAGAVREAKERIRVAFRNSGYAFPNDRILINLAPAGVRKEGAALDLPIALALARAARIAPAAPDTLVLGELELSGKLRPVRGALAAAAAGKKAGIRFFVVPRENRREMEILSAPSYVAGVSTLQEAVSALEYRDAHGVFPEAEKPEERAAAGPEECAAGDFADVRGQGRYKRALEIAAAGAHNLFVFGTPGVGKTMLARRLPTIMPELDAAEAISVTKVYSLAAGAPLEGLITRPPFRSPHHSASAEGILGGGKNIRPGEISLAHFGALFLDEAPEFRANVLQALREPLEDKVITISRAEGPVRLPAEFQLILAANPCPCGKLGMVPAEGDGGAASSCLCAGDEINRYWKKMGAALLDRIDLRVALHTGAIASLPREGEETSAQIACRVRRAVEMQKERGAALGMRRNALLRGAALERYCSLTARADAALKTAVEKLCLSGRAYHSVLRMARTIADLAGKDALDTEEVLEAVQHRRLGNDPYDILLQPGGQPSFLPPKM
jgi:magnesium chelatase family protein